MVASVEEIAYGMLRSQSSYSTDQFSISVRGLDGRTLLDPMVVVSPDGDAEALTIIAKTARLRFDPDAGELTISLTDYTIEYGDNKAQFSDEGTKEQTFSLLDDLRSGASSKRPSQYALNELAGKIASQRSSLKQIRQSYAADAGFHLLTANLDSLMSKDWKQRQVDLVFGEQRLHRLQTEPYRRWANGFSCLGFIFVGVPLAVRFRNADLMTTFGMCFLPILIVYYPLLMFATEQAKSGELPPYSVWLGNVVLCLTGGLLWRHVVLVSFDLLPLALAGASC